MGRHFCPHPLCQGRPAGTRGFRTREGLVNHRRTPHVPGRVTVLPQRHPRKRPVLELDWFVALSFEAGGAFVNDRHALRSIAEAIVGRLVPREFWVDEDVLLALQVHVAKLHTKERGQT